MTILSIIVSSVDYAYLTPSTVSTVVDTLYPGISKGQRPWIADASKKVIGQTTTPIAADANHAIAVQRNSLRPLHPRIQTGSDQPTDKTYWVDLPMGTASTARAPIEALLQSSLNTKYLTMKNPPKEIPYFDVICSENAKVVGLGQRTECYAIGGISAIGGFGRRWLWLLGLREVRGEIARLRCR